MGKNNKKQLRINTATTQQNVEVEVSARGVTPEVASMSFQDLETPVVSGIPADSVVVGESFTINVADITSEPTVVAYTNAGALVDRGVEVGSVVTNPAGGYDVEITPRVSGFYKLVLSGDSFADYEVLFSCKVADSVVIVPETATVVTSDKTISFEVTNTTKQVEVISLDPDVTVTPRTQDPNNKIFDITVSSAMTIQPRIAIRGIGVNEEIFSPMFRAGDIIQLSLVEKKVRAGSVQTIKVSGADNTRTLIATVPQEYSSIVTATVVDYETVTVEASSEVSDVPVTIGGDYVEESSVEVTFLPTKDTLSYTLSSTVVNSSLTGDDTTFVGSYIVMKVSGTNETLSFSSDSPDVVIKDGGSQYEKVITSTAVGTPTIRVRGTDVTDLDVQLEFVARPQGGPQFELVKDSYSFPVTTKKFTFPVSNLEGALTARSTSFKVKTNVIDNMVELTLSDYVPNPIDCQIILSVEGQEDRTVNINVYFPEELKTMSCAGERLEFTVGESVKFVIPTRDEDDVVEIIPNNNNLVYKLDVNVVTLTSNTVGSYTVLVKHSEYKDAMVSVEVKDLNQVVAPAPVIPEKNEWYDVGSSPDVSVTVNNNGFYGSVFDSQLISTDKERIAYILDNGSIGETGPIHIMLTYEETTGASSVFRGGDYVAKQNYSLYYMLKGLMGVENYYTFKGNFRAILKVFKLYKDSAYSLPYLLRFDEKWPGSDSELAKYKQLVAWIVKYVETDGQGMGSYVKSLKDYVTETTLNNLTQFCSQSVRV